MYKMTINVDMFDALMKICVSIKIRKLLMYLLRVEQDAQSNSQKALSWIITHVYIITCMEAAWERLVGKLIC